MQLPRATLPGDLIFSRLLQIATYKHDEAIVDDCSRDTKFGYRHILHGTAKLAQSLQGLLGKSTLDKRGGFYVAVLAPNGYEFIIAVLAVFAIGGVVVPLPTGALPAEAAYLLQQCSACHLLVGPEQIDLAAQIRKQIDIPTIAIENQANDVNTLLPITAYVLDPALAVPEDCPSIVFFTSGTTGPPKGVLHARRTINKFVRMEEAKPNDEVCLIPKAAFWSLYFTKTFHMLLIGVRVEIQNFGRNYDLIWEKFREQTGTRIVLSPTFWYGMMHFFQNHIAKLPEHILKEYVQGAQYLRDVSTTGAMPSKQLKKFWQDLRGGRPLKVVYGCTETQEISVCDNELDSAEGDLGVPMPNALMKLSAGEEGELLVKTPSLFLGYLSSSGVSTDRFDSDGFFKTGDLAIYQHGRYIFQGRANFDLFKFYTYKVPRTKVEARLNALPYIQEGYVLPVADPQCDTRVAALVRLDDSLEKVDLNMIRNDLSTELPAYQLPTILRVLEKHESIPETWTNKTAMMKIIDLFFAVDSDGRICDGNTEVLDVSGFMQGITSKP